MSDSHVLQRIGHAIRQVRLRLNYTQERLSAISGIDRSFLGKIERGEVNVSVLTLCEIAKGLNITFSQLIEQAHDSK